MPKPQPDNVEAITFNASLTLSGEDEVELRRKVFELGALYRKGGWVAGLGLLHVHSMLGDRPAALKLADEFWARRDNLSPPNRLTLAILITALGLYERAIALVDDINNPLPANMDLRRHAIGAESFLVNWNLTPAQAASFKLEENEAFGVFFEEVDGAGLLNSIQARQRAVNAILLPEQCGCQVLLASDGEGVMAATRYVFVAADYDGRRRLSERVSDAVVEWCEASGIDEGLGRSLFSEVIMPVTARGPVGYEAVKALL